MGICIEKDKGDYYLSGIIKGVKEKEVNEKNSFNNNSSLRSIKREDTNINVNVTNNSLHSDKESNYRNNNDDDNNNNKNKNEDKDKNKNEENKKYINNNIVTNMPIEQNEEKKEDNSNKKKEDSESDINYKFLESQIKNENKSQENEESNKDNINNKDNKDNKDSQDSQDKPKFLQSNVGIDSSQKHISEYSIINDINKTNNIKKENNVYENFDVNKEYYLICSKCNSYIIYIYSVEFDNNINDFKVTYNCLCGVPVDNNNEEYLHLLLKDEKIMCVEHNKEIKFICQKCRKQICIECRDASHQFDDVRTIINKGVISESILETISKEEHNLNKGFEIFQKLFNFYKEQGVITKLPINNSQIKNDSKNNGNDVGGDLKINIGYEISIKEEADITQIEIENKSQGKKENKNNINNVGEKVNNIYKENILNNLNEINSEDNTFTLLNSFEKKGRIKNENKKINNEISNTNNNINDENNSIINKSLKNLGIKYSYASYRPSINSKKEEEPNVIDNNPYNNKKEEKNKLDEIKKEENNNSKVNKQEEDDKINEIKKEENPEEIKKEDDKSSKIIDIEIVGDPQGNIKEENDIKEEDNKLDEIKKEDNNNPEDNKKEEDNKPEEFNIIINSTQNLINPNKNILYSSINNNQELMENNDNSSNNRRLKAIEEDEFKNAIILSNANYNGSIIEDINQNNEILLKEYKNTKTFKGHENKVSAIIELKSRYIATGSYDCSIKIWDITKNPETALVATKYSIGYILCLLELEPDILLAGNSSNTIDVFYLSSESIDPCSHLLGHTLWVNGLVKCDDNNFASCSNDARIIIWDSKKKIKLRELVGHVDSILTMILLNNGYLCSGSADKTIRIWDWKKGNSLFYIKAHTKWVKTLYQINDNNILSGSDDTTIKIWDINLRFLVALKGHGHSVRTLCKINDNYFASGSFDNTIKIWDLNEKKCVQTLRGHLSNIIGIINFNGKIISCSNDKTIKIWENI